MIATSLSRRGLVLGALALLPLISRRALAEEVPSLEADLEALEQRAGGRLGVCLLDTGSGLGVGRRLDERFALCSTFKILLAGQVLARCAQGEERLDTPIRVPRRGLIAHSPVTEEHRGETLTVGELCHAAVTTSDNTATNLLLGRSGGPAALTAFLRGLGDARTRIDRVEPEMNDVRLDEGEERDTTCPSAMAASVAALTVGEALPPEQRAILVGWARATVTGLTRLRAGWPEDWQAGDKTGTGMDRYTNDVGVAWPPGRAPIVVSAYLDRPGHTMEENAAVLAEVGRLVAARI